MKVKSKSDYRKRRHFRLRNKVSGTAERPRMAVYFSNRGMYVQFIDDEARRTLCSVSMPGCGCTVEKAREAGAKAAQVAASCSITKVVFDRGGFAYRARMKALADSAREAGIEF